MMSMCRAGGTPRVFDEVYVPSTFGIFVRECTFGPTQLVISAGRAFGIRHSLRDSAPRR